MEATESQRPKCTEIKEENIIWRTVQGRYMVIQELQLQGQPPYHGLEFCLEQSTSVMIVWQIASESSSLVKQYGIFILASVCIQSCSSLPVGTAL